MSTTQTTASGSDDGFVPANPHMTERWKPILVFTLFALVISLAGGLVFQRYKESIKKDKQDELAGIAELKIGQITNWIVERKGDAESLTHDPFFMAEVERWLQRGGISDGARDKLGRRLWTLQKAYSDHGYTSISLFDNQGKLRLSSRNGDGVVPEHEKLAILESIRSGKATLSDMHSSIRGAKQVIEIDLVAPLLVGSEDKKHVIGAVVFHTDPSRFLFPLLQRWPTPSQSAENLLVRRDGDDVVFLNELRHRKSTALAMRLPLSNRDLPAAMAILGRRGLMEGVDYRGVPVVGVLHKVPGTQWAMVSKIDKAEIYAPINSLGNWILLLLLALIGAGGGVAAFWWKKQRQYVRALEERHEQKIEREVLTRHLGYLAKFSNDIIWLKDAEGVYLSCNLQFERFFGAKENDIVGKTDYDFLDAELADVFRQKDREVAIAGKPCINEEWGTYPDDGQRVLLETIKTPICDEDGKLIGVMGIARDITERKRSEDELRFKDTLLTAEYEASIEGILVVDGTGKIISCNRRFAGMWGIAEDIVGSGFGASEPVLQAILDQMREPGLLMEKVRHLYRHSDEAGRDEIELRDERVFEYNTTPMIGPKQECYGRIWYFRDLTGQKSAAKNLARSYAKLQRLSLRMENARADERAKIALNLHDEMGATLAAMKMRVAWLTSRLPAGMPQLAEEAAHISELVSGGIQTMHRIVSELRPDLLSDVGLTAAIANYVKKFRRHSNMECTLVLPESELMLGEEQALTVFRILQESLSNVVKHAQAGKVSIIVAAQDKSLSMVVKDDGIGFDADVKKEQSFGLLGIRERALMVGGKARISSAPGKGTRISVSIPYQGRRISDPEAHHA